MVTVVEVGMCDSGVSTALLGGYILVDGDNDLLILCVWPSRICWIVPYSLFDVLEEYGEHQECLSTKIGIH